VATLRDNREWTVIDRDIHSDAATSDRILASGRLKVGEADLLVGGPPCQPFSKSGYWARGDSRRLSDPRATTLEAYLRVLRDTQPRTFLLENVPGLKFSGKSEGLDLMQRTIDAINAEIGTSYSFHVQILRAVEHGVPQDRQRVFIIGSRDGTAFAFPAPTHEAPPAAAAEQREFLNPPVGGLLPFLRAWDAIGELDQNDDPTLALSGKWADLLASIPEGANYQHHTDRGEGLHLFGWRRRYWSFLLKLSKRLPSWTLTANPGSAIGPFHWRNRRLSTEEMLRLQTFPKGYRIIGNQRSAQRQLGNAVPSALAERLALEIRRQLLGGIGVRSGDLSLLPQRRCDIPPPEPVAGVPHKYHTMVGKHDAHPGTGKGPGALARATDD
jgi:DNA (cytosine-5)-methyltransferase 1